MPFGPIVAGTRLAEDEIVWPEDLAIGPRSDAIHGAGLEIHEHGPRDIAAAAGLIVVDIDTLDLDVGVADVATGGVDAVLGADHLPELGPDLVAALATLNVKDFTHFWRVRERREVGVCGG